MNKQISSKQIKKVADWYGVDVTEVNGYARLNDDGTVFDFQLHFSDGSSAWLDGSRGRGLYLSGVK